MKSSEIRQAFLDYFARQDHEVVASSPLVPANDPTLLFTNAGLVQFKDVFLGQDKRPYVRATSSQRCVRAGGKHNDLENVGYTARHHTFFEMLGNFSFGDYFKREAIQFAWEFLTVDLKLPPEKLWVTVFREDDEAADIWLQEIGVDADRFTRMGEKDNFWAMGDTGPCGPCSEIFYDHGPEVEGGPPGSPEEDGDRYIEIWNLVFMQYERDAGGELKPLPRPSVDTGMGLERIAAVLQGVHSNYEIDLFRNLLKAVAAVTGAADPMHVSARVIADHIRSCAFLVNDGVVPSNEGRGYVLRRIIRRAIRHGYRLGKEEPFFHQLVKPLADEMGAAYPELERNRANIERVLRNEEDQFARTLDQGMGLLNQEIENLSGDLIPGEVVFRLYDTYGFPVDLTADVAREQNLRIDMEGFEACMAGQRERARGASRFQAELREGLAVEGDTEFTGYEYLEDQAPVTALFRDGEAVESLAAGSEGIIVLERTPFYAESGGQVGDTGIISGDGFLFEVTDCVKEGSSHLHQGVLKKGALKIGVEAHARVDAARRQATRLNHSATHLLHAALREILGEHVTQKGSLVDAERLRFDFSHFEAVTPEQLQEIEDRVNEQVRINSEVRTEVCAMDEAKGKGAMMLFGEKYGEEVRVLTMGEGFSVELCGGTHAGRTGDIGLFRIVAETGIAAGVRRIEAVTGQGALEYDRATEQSLAGIQAIVKGDRASVAEKVRKLAEKNRELEKELERLKSKLAGSTGSDLADQAVEVDGIKVLAARVDGVEPKILRDTLDRLKNRLGSSVVVLGSVRGDKVSLIAGATGDLTDRIKAGELVNMVAEQVGGRGGGRADMAQAGGSQPESLPGALASVVDWVRERL